jgi:hypothetical protein
MSGKTKEPKRDRQWEVHQLRLLPFGGSELMVHKPRKTPRAVRGGCDAACHLVEGELARFISRWTGIPSSVLVADEATHIPKGAFEELRRLGLLLPGGTARAVSCEACDLDHVEWVETVAAADGAQRFFIACPQEGRVEVDRRRVQQWRVDFTPLARAIKESLMAFGTVEQVHPGRLWKLGRASLAGCSRDLWMAREVSAGPGPELDALLPKAGAPVIFLLGWPPEKPVPAPEAGAVFDVARVVHLRHPGLHVDRRAVERRLRTQKARAEAAQMQLRCCCG